MIKQIGSFTVTGSAAWCEFARFVIKELNNWEVFLPAPDCSVGFLAKYPQHAHMLEQL